MPDLDLAPSFGLRTGLAGHHSADSDHDFADPPDPDPDPDSGSGSGFDSGLADQDIASVEASTSAWALGYAG